MTDPEQKKMVMIFSLLISFVGFFLVLISDIGGFYLPGYGSRYSCLTCDYGTIVGRTSIVLTVLSLIVQTFFSYKNLSSNAIDESILGKCIIFAVITIVLSVVGGVEFAIVYGDYEWWFLTSFYAGLIAGTLNLVLFLILRNQE